MRKQTKVVAVASAAALLAIGASMTSFAAGTGWQMEDGIWYYYDKDGNRVEDEWRKSVDGNWYWLDSEENGAMATGKLIEDGDDTYFVDDNGVMVTNTWVKVVNEDQDEETDPAEYRYYYMQSTGKAVKGNGTSTKKKTIDGKQFAFAEDGKMLYGWVKNGALAAGESDWKEADFYFGGWEDGSMKTGWQKINVYDAYKDADDDADKWFYFKSNGEKVYNEKASEGEKLATRKVNGKTYGFDENGVMIYEWNEIATDSPATATAGNWGYFNSPEDGARIAKGWFKVVPDEGFDDERNWDEEEAWYYSDSDGTLIVNQIKKIGGKYYAFADDGAMLSGLVKLSFDAQGNMSVEDNSVDADELDNIVENNTLASDEFLYYFGTADDGAMKTGNVTVDLDGDKFAFNFRSTGGKESRGQGVTGLVNKVNYKYGKKMTASSDAKYVAIYTDANGMINIEESGTLRRGVSAFYPSADTYTLIGTNGQIKKNANGVKDGDDWYFYTNKYGVVYAYVNDKDIASTPAFAAKKAAAANWGAPATN